MFNIGDIICYKNDAFWKVIEIDPIDSKLTLGLIMTKTGLGNNKSIIKVSKDTCIKVDSEFIIKKINQDINKYIKISKILGYKEIVSSLNSFIKIGGLYDNSNES